LIAVCTGKAKGNSNRWRRVSAWRSPDWDVLENVENVPDVADVPNVKQFIVHYRRRDELRSKAWTSFSLPQGQLFEQTTGAPAEVWTSNSPYYTYFVVKSTHPPTEYNYNTIP